MSEAEWSKIVGLLPESAAIDTYIGRICQEKGEHGLSTRAKDFLERASLFAKYRATQEEAKLLFKAVLRNGDTLVEARDAEMVLSVMAIENSLRIWWVRFSTFEVQIVPKLAGDNLGLVELIDYATGLDSLARYPSVRTIAAAGTSLFDLVALLFVEACERVLRNGLLSDYCEVEDDRAPKGTRAVSAGRCQVQAI
jgi:hypothetical protein